MSVDTPEWDIHRALVKVSGDLDISTVAPLWAVLDGHLAAGRRYLRLDLSEVTFMDAASLGGIIRVHHRALDHRGTLVLTGARPPVTRMLRLTGMDDVLFVGGPRADDDLASAVPIDDEDPAATVWPARPLPCPPGAITRT
ncbi:MAG: anti-sigma factor antagonist [Pseudonocardiales bacterium]|jgi:stage II sporulation protein AA (anti-sigma F factor antagonist)|nr:anti-sigma factor antagonist [Pseudonocardiales bacterium]